jgi:hypothetical protein
MILEVVTSINGVPIRLTDERWEHIVDEHPNLSTYYDEILAAVESPEYILRGHGKGRRIAVVSVGRRFLHVPYRELGRTDGFIVTAYLDDEVNENLILWRADKQQ